MSRDSRRADATRAGFGCLAVLIPVAVAAGLAIVVFAWNVNAPA